ncbi:MAG: hypothetical protein LJE67_06145 [Salaquimonas sp.]|jgi:GMP synthase-like glutamine amidotransferase|nr:hypothetical protein [Salaquimonas sp.]
MKTIAVIQHVEAEYLGFLEDHLEARNIRFRYFRPFTAGGTLPAGPDENPGEFDGLIVLGQGPLGIVSGPLVPTLAPELRIIRTFLDHGLPVVGVGLGAIMLAVAAGGGAEEAPLRIEVGRATRENADALGGAMPESFPYATYIRDRAVLPKDAEVLARNEAGEPVAFRCGASAIGFTAHPGIKSAMIEDIIMEFEESPDDVAEKLESLRNVQGGIAEALTSIMVGLVAETGWMRQEETAQKASSPS